MGIGPSNPLLQRNFPFLRCGIWIPLLTLWILSTAWLIVRFRALDSDSIMYGLPLAFAKGPFSLSIPLIGDFPPYSTAWGHQWPGAMWLRGALFSVIPFERWIDISLLLACQFCAAFLGGAIVWRLTRGAAASLCTVAVILSDRVVIAGLQLHRFEAIVILALVALLLALIHTAGSGKAETQDGPIQKPKSNPQNPSPPWLIVSFFAAFVAACTHPFGMAISAGLVGMAGLDWLVLRRRFAGAALVPATGFLLGVASVAAYFVLVPEAKAEFLANLALQNAFNGGSRLALLTHLRYYHWVGFPLWGLSILAIPLVFWKLIHRQRADAVFSAWALPLAALAVPVLFFLTRSANNSYAALGTPFVAILLATAVALIPRDRQPLLRPMATILLCLLAFGFLTVFPYRWLVFFKSGRPDFPAEMREIVGRMPPGVRVFIPPPLWDVARKDPSRNYRLYTLSIASPWNTRLAYEKKLYAEAKQGDILVVDRISGRTGDPWGILPTFETLPPNPRYWKPSFEAIRRIPGAGNDFGYDLAVYEFRGEPWDPADFPRAMIGR